MIRSGLIIMIKDLANKGKSAGAISREIGIAENTARKYMTQPAKPHGLKGTKKRRNWIHINHICRNL